ncbi:MAG: GHKL domain-containing protein [Butyrivibrio sp.]|nr:GHKL domain-containing protein [Acetatifactor muris]MCM1561516.1 GHKL domain-containing protein [Butyrivibrio sp.]
MNAYVYAVISNLLDYWILILIMQYVCAAHMDLGRRNAIIRSCISVLWTTFTALCPLPAVFNFFATMTAEIVLSVCLFSRRRLSDLLRFFPAVCVYLFLDLLPVALVEEIVSPANIQLAAQEDSRTLFSFMADATLLILLLILRHVQLKYGTRVHFSGKEVFGSIALLFLSFIDGALILMVNRAQHTPLWYWLYMFIFVGGYLLGVGYFAYSLVESGKRIYRQTMARCETDYLQVQLDALQEVKENEAEVRKMRHDLTNHLAVISSLCQEGDYEEVRRYTEQLSHEVPSVGGRIPTGSRVADLVVASKSRICEANGIVFEFSGNLENLRGMAATDLCGLLANAYDNAIEACMTQTERYIRTRVSTTRNYTVIEIVNPVEKKVSVRGNSIPTGKKNKKDHGYGIEIMKQIAGKYNGSCTMRCDGREFCLKLALLT